MGSPALQLPCGDLIFLSPMSFSEAFDRVISALFTNGQIEILDLIEQTAFLHYQKNNCTPFSSASLTQCGFDADDLEEKAETLFKMRYRSAQFIGYLCLLASQTIKPNSIAIPQLLEKFISSVATRNLETRTSVIRTLISIVKQTGNDFLVKALQNFNDSTQKLSSEKELLLLWLTHLATCHETKIVHLVCNLWIQYREKYPSDLRCQTDLNLITSFSSRALPEALHLFLLYQQTSLLISEQELACLNSLLQTANTVSDVLFITCIPRLQSILTNSLSSGRPYTHGITISLSFIEALTETLRHFLIAQQFLQARSLWELAAHHSLLFSHQESLKKGWRLLAEAAIENQCGIHETTFLWKKGQEGGLYESLIFSLTKELLKYPGNEQGIKNLVTLMKENSKEPKIVELVSKHLEKLISTPKIDLSAKMILQFSPLFSDFQKLAYYPLIIKQLINHNEWKLAVNIWFLLPYNSPSAKLTKNLLSGLIKRNCSPLALSLALKVIQSKRTNNLPPDSRQNFLKQISSAIAANPHQRNMISFFHVALREFPSIPAKDQLEILLPVLQAMVQMDSIKPRIFKRMISVLPYVFELLKKSNNLLTVAQLISLVDLEEIPSTLHPQLFNFHKDIVKHLINTNNIPLGLVWITKGKTWMEDPSRHPWMQELTTFLISLNTHAFAEFVLAEEELLLQTFSSDDLTFKIDAWLSYYCEPITEQMLNLLIKYPPCHASCWEKLFLKATSSQLSTLWDIFNVWRLKPKAFNPHLDTCWLTALKTIHKMDSPPFKELLKEQISLSDSSLFSSLKSRQLILSGFLEIETEEYEDFMMVYKKLPNSSLTMMIDLLEKAAEKSPSSIKLCIDMLSHIYKILFTDFNMWELRILSILRSLIDKGPGANSKEAFSALFQLTITLQSYVLLLEGISTDQPLDASSELKKTRLEEDLTLLALSISKYNYPEALECCHLILKLLQGYSPSNLLRSRVWGNYLIHRAKEEDVNLDLIESKITMLIEHYHMWKSEESASHDCTQLVIDLIVTSLFKNQLTIQFWKPLHLFLHKVTKVNYHQESTYLKLCKYNLKDELFNSLVPTIIEGFPENCGLPDLSASKCSPPSFVGK